MQHKYTVGQMVDLTPSPRLSNRPSGPCLIKSCLPFEGRSLQYRVQSRRESVERVVSEADLRPSTAAAQAAVFADTQSQAETLSVRVTRR